MSPFEAHSTPHNPALSAESAVPDADQSNHAVRPGASRAHDAVLALGRRAIAKPDPNVLVQDAARLIAEIAGTELALISQGEDDINQRLVPVVPDVAAPEPDEGTDGASLAKVAVNEAHPIVVPDLLHSNVYSDRYLRRQGIRGTLIVPLRLQNAAFGALGACSCQRIDFEVDAIYVAETIAHLVATTLAHYRSEAMLQESRRVTKTLHDTLDAIILVVDSSGCVQNMNRACRETTGFTPEDFMDRPVWSVLAPPQEIQAYRDAITSLTTSKRPVALEATLLTKHSEYRIIAWRLAVSSSQDNDERTIILTGIDITKQRLAEERAERAKRALAHLRSSGGGEDELDDTIDSLLSESGRSGELASGRRLSETERRMKPRRPFPYSQNIAYMPGNTYPCEEDFFEVRCRDIAAGGFSFVSPMPPKTELLVVALGSPQHLTYLTARVVHVTQVVEDSEMLHLVGCQYTGRAPS